MKLIDIDNLAPIDSHIHYIKNYKGRAVLMDMKSNIFRYEILFSIEYDPVGPPKIKVNFKEHPNFPILVIMPKIKKRINELSDKGMLSSIS